MRSALRIHAALVALTAAAPALAQPDPPDVVWARNAGGATRSVAFSPDGQLVASGAARADSARLGRVDVRNVADGALLASAEAHPAAPGGLGPARSVAFAPDGLALASGHGALVCDPLPCAEFGAGVFTWAAPTLAPLAGRTDAPSVVPGVAYAPGGGPLAAAYATGPIRLLNPATLEDQQVLPGHDPSARAVAVSPDGARVASVGDDGMLRVWDAATGTLQYAVEHGTAAAGGLPVSVAFSANGALIATGGDGFEPVVRVWQTDDGALVHEFEAQVLYGVGAGAATSLAFSPNGRYLLAGLSQEYNFGAERLAGLWFWDLVIGDHAALYEDTSAPDADGIRAVALSAAHDHLFAYAVGGEVRVAQTPLSLAVPVADEGVFTPVGNTLPQGDVYESVAPADYDQDGDLDLLVVRGDGRFPDTYFPELYRNDGLGADSQFAFTLAPFPAEPYPAATEGGMPYGETLSWADYDNDGDVDALVATAYGTALYRNDVGTFTDSGVPLPVYEEFLTWGFAEPTSSAWGDYDNDGDLDLVLPETAPGGPWPSPDSTKLVLYENDGSTLTPTDAPFPLVDRDPHVVWGDVESDGDLDLLYLSSSSNCDELPLGECLVIYQNDGGALAPRPYDFPRFDGAAADFGDFDLDGDLDILLVAKLENPDGPPFFIDRALVYRNDGATFEADTLAFPFTFDEYFQSLTGGQWADYDSDGDVDVLIGADVNDYGGPNPDFRGVAFVFANTDGAFTLAAAIPSSERGGTRTWADFDSDGDLDFLTTGSRVEGGPWVDFARLYLNDAPLLNRAPSPPPGLTASPTDSGVSLSWGAAADDHTDSDALTYNLWVQRNGSDIVSPMSRGGGTRLLPAPGNVSLNTAWSLRDLPEGEYTWAVQAVDNAFNGGPFADGGAFTVGEGAAAPLTVEPVAPPVVIATEGGAFEYRVTLHNPTARARTAEVWSEARLPDGQVYGPVEPSRVVTLGPGQTVGPVVLRVRVPAAAPPGRYVYGVRVGRHPGLVVAEDGFAVVKEGAARAAAATSDDVAWAEAVVSGTFAEAGVGVLPSALALHAPVPNPSRGRVAVAFDLPAPSEVAIRLYDVLGREVLAVPAAPFEAGAGREVALDAGALPSGTYLLRLDVRRGGEVERRTTRLTLAR